jgi:hypothetical protein
MPSPVQGGAERLAGLVIILLLELARYIVGWKGCLIEGPTLACMRAQR